MPKLTKSTETRPGKAAIEAIVVNTALCFYAALVLTMLFFHEPWRDEAQAWLVVRDLDFLGILSQMKYEFSRVLSASLQDIRRQSVYSQEFQNAGG